MSLKKNDYRPVVIDQVHVTFNVDVVL